MIANSRSRLSNPCGLVFCCRAPDCRVPSEGASGPLDTGREETEWKRYVRGRWVDAQPRAKGFLFPWSSLSSVAGRGAVVLPMAVTGCEYGEARTPAASAPEGRPAVKLATSAREARTPAGVGTGRAAGGQAGHVGAGGANAGGAGAGGAAGGQAAVTSVDGGAVDRNADVPAPRLIAPLSTATVTSRRPTFHWTLTSGTDGAQIQLPRPRLQQPGGDIRNLR